MSGRNILRADIAKVFVHNGTAVEIRSLFVQRQLFDLFNEDNIRIVSGVSDDEAQVDEVVRVC